MIVRIDINFAIQCHICLNRSELLCSAACVLYTPDREHFGIGECTLSSVSMYSQLAVVHVHLPIVFATFLYVMLTHSNGVEL
jgi:hypothetical protein